MRKYSRKDAIYGLALAGISAAVALLFVGLSVLVRFTTIAFYIAGGIALTVPMTKKYYLSSILAYAATSALAFLIAGDIITVVGFVAYFAPISLLTAFMYNKHVKWYIQLPVKIVFINGILALLYFVCHTIVVSDAIMDRLSYPIIAVVGTILLVAIDFAEQFIYSKLILIVDKVLRHREQPEENNSDIHPFEDDADLYDDAPVIFERKQEPKSADLEERTNPDANSENISANSLVPGDNNASSEDKNADSDDDRASSGYIDIAGSGDFSNSDSASVHSDENDSESIGAESADDSGDGGDDR